MKPASLKTRIFLDTGDPQETKEVIKLLGFLDGQTTNPTLIAKNPAAQKRLAEGKKFTSEEIFSFYMNVVQEISKLIPDGSVSIEVYAEPYTPNPDPILEQGQAWIHAIAMFEQGKGMNTWIPNAHIKYPTTGVGLAAAEMSIKENMRVNMTLCFSQEQGAAVYAATKGAQKGQVFLSPFVGRLDDIGENGMDLIKNTIEMFKNSDHHVEVLSASVRSVEQLMYALHLGSDIITAPYKILKEWGEKGMPFPDANFVYNHSELKPIPAKNLDLNQPWQNYAIAHDLTAKGIEKFSHDWHALTE